MIYSSQGQFLFVHISRCAGNLISNSLYLHYSDCKQIGVQHSPCKEALIELEADFAQLYKFCIVRNPWERLASWFELYQISSQLSPQGSAQQWSDFSTFLEHSLSEKKIVQGQVQYAHSQCAMITDENNRILVDKIFRFESLNQALSELSKKLNMKFESNRKINPSLRKHYSLYYDDESIEKVARTCEQDISFFNYQFDDCRL